MVIGLLSYFVLQGLELNQQDPWSAHALTHVLEMQGRFEEGITFLESTVKDWEVTIN